MVESEDYRQQVKKLVQNAMATIKELLQSLQTAKHDEFSNMFTSMLETVLDYSNTNPTLQMDTRTGTLFSVHNAVTGYFHILKNYKDTETKIISVMSGIAGTGWKI